MGWGAPIPALVLQLLERVCEASTPQAGYMEGKPLPGAYPVPGIQSPDSGL